MTPPLVSIVLPTRNRAAVLVPTLDSVRAQTLADWELLLVDDGSTDGTEELVRRFDEPRFVYMKNARGRGVARARNSALERARGEFIAFQDAGETWPAGKLALQVEAMRRLPSSVGLVYGNYTIHEPGGRVRLSRPEVFDAADEDTARRALALAVSTIDTPTWLLRRAVYAACGGFDEELARREDTDYLIRAALSGFRFQYVDALTAQSYEREESLSKDPDTLLRAHEYMTKKYADRLTPELLACHHRSLGRILLELRPTRLAQARRSLWKAAQPPHGRPADWLWLALSLGGNPAYRLAIGASALLRRVGLRR